MNNEIYEKIIKWLAERKCAVWVIEQVPAETTLSGYLTDLDNGRQLFQCLKEENNTNQVVGRSTVGVLAQDYASWYIKEIQPLLK